MHIINMHVINMHVIIMHVIIMEICAAMFYAWVMLMENWAFVTARRFITKEMTVQRNTPTPLSSKGRIGNK